MASKYDQNTKDEVIAFIQEYNEENGRGGQSAAVKKWNLNPVTVKSWLKKAGVATPGRGGKKKRVAGKPGRPPGRKPGRKAVGRPGRKPAVAAGGDLQSTLGRLIAIQAEIGELQAEEAKLKSYLKAKL